MAVLKVFGSAAGLVLLILILGIPLALINGWVLSWLWLWFAVPLGIPAITVVHGMGLAGLVGLLTKQYVPQKDNAQGEFWAYAVMTPLVTLGIGWIIHQFM